MLKVIKYIKKKKYFKVRIMSNVQIDRNTKIGQYTYIGEGTKITKSTIGRYCSIAPDVSIGLGEHDWKRISTSSLFYKGNVYENLTKESISIGNDVWIGTKAIILRGVKVGNGAIIGAGAVVTKDVPSYSIVAGVPAKVLKYRFSNEEIYKIEISKWWEKEIDDAKSIVFKMEDDLNIA
jgi:acetyltransferase-like isoleucine patch superfamily enzyme